MLNRTEIRGVCVLLLSVICCFRAIGLRLDTMGTQSVFRSLSLAKDRGWTRHLAPGKARIPLTGASHISPCFAFVPRGGGGSARLASSTPDLSCSAPRQRRITFWTDIEGDRDYLTRYVNRSLVLCFRKTVPRLDQRLQLSVKNDNTTYFPYNHCLDFAHEHDVVVYGGDVWDQGGSDLYVIRQLLDLHQRYPDRVFFVMGNRDVNKMRVIQELGCPGSGASPSHYGVYWLQGTQRVGDPALGIMSNNPVERLKWMLSSTMGSPRAFDNRQWELQQERESLGQVDRVMDEDVVESYRKSCYPTGEMGRYLSLANITVRLGEVLFLHGALPLTADVLKVASKRSVWDDMTFAMPWLEPSVMTGDNCVDSVDDWFDALNMFASEKVQNWQRHPIEDEYWSRAGGYKHTAGSFSQLIQYGMGWIPGQKRNPTVIYASWSTNGMPRRFFPDPEHSSLDEAFVNMTHEFFERSNLRLLCSGHQPQGDMPNTIRVARSGEDQSHWIVNGDTSYSGDTLWHHLPGEEENRKNVGRGRSRSGRGPVAVSEAIIEQCSDTGKVLRTFCHGVLSDGSEYCTVPINFSSDIPKEALSVGRLASSLSSPSIKTSPHRGLWWTKAAFDDGTCLLAAGEGFRFWNRIVSS